MIHLESIHELPFPRAEVWPILSQTDWLNRALGLPAVEYAMTPAPGGGSQVNARTRLMGFEVRWREHPFEWREPEYYRVRRVFENGPFLEARLGVEFLEPVSGRCRLVVGSDWECRHALGETLLRRVVGPQSERDLARVLVAVEEHLRRRTPVVVPGLAGEPVQEAAWAAACGAMRTASVTPDWEQRLERMLRDAPEQELAHLRPLVWARRWGMSADETLRVFLEATRAGLLELSWEVLCPNCRSARATPVRALADLRGHSHCDVCQIAFDAEFDRSVELKFAVHPSVRVTTPRTYCLAGPGGTPHVVARLTLAAGEERTWPLPAGGRTLRVRSPQVRAAQIWSPDEARRWGAPARLVCGPEKFEVERSSAAPEAGTVQLSNPNPHPVVIDWELLAWSDDILTAGRVVNWQSFRDLFAREVIHPGEQIRVGRQVVIFTDLLGSTALYRSLGDAVAYARVRDHFAIVTAAVERHHGVVVKTIGDAVMAAFSRLDEALAAVQAMQVALATANPAEGPALRLKSSLHAGPCLAVNANDRVDYFGTTINLAARMVGCSRGGDVIVADELYGRDEVTRWRENLGTSGERLEMQFRGFAESQRVWRIPILPGAGSVS